VYLDQLKHWPHLVRAPVPSPLPMCTGLESSFRMASATETVSLPLISIQRYTSSSLTEQSMHVEVQRDSHSHSHIILNYTATLNQAGILLQLPEPCHLAPHKLVCCSNHILDKLINVLGGDLDRRDGGDSLHGRGRGGS